MIVRAGGRIILHAPDGMPEAARPAVDALREMTARACALPPDTVMPDPWSHIAALEVAAFGRRHAVLLRRCGQPARLAVSRQLLVGWGQAVTTGGGIPC